MRARVNPHAGKNQGAQYIICADAGMLDGISAALLRGMERMEIGMAKAIRTLGLALACMLLASCSVMAEERTGTAQGYGGTIRVRVRMDGERLAEVKVVEHHETDGIGTRAIEALPQAMVQEGSAQVEAVSGATVTSRALMRAVGEAMGTGIAPASTKGLRPGTGMCATARLGPGTDSEGAAVYSFNVVFASALFDADGRVQHLAVDQLEVMTPNAQGASSTLGGWPGQGGYAMYNADAGAVSGKTGDSEDDFLQEVAAWTSKRALGEGYRLTSGTWAQEMDAYEKLLTGKTVEEIAQWFRDYCSDETGRPLRADSGSEADRVKWGVLTQEDQQMLTDVTSGATMSLRDSHGDILTAIERAWQDAQSR